MEIKIGFEIAYAAAAPTPMVIMLSIPYALDFISTAWLDRGDADVHLHADEDIGWPKISTMQRQRLHRIACDRDTDQIARALDAVGRIELDPAGVRQIDLYPGMGRAAARVCACRRRTDNPKRSARRCRAGAASRSSGAHSRGRCPSRSKGVERMLGTRLVTLAIARAHRGYRASSGSRSRTLASATPHRGSRAPRPTACPRDRCSAARIVLQVRIFLGIVDERIEISGIVRRQREGRHGRVIDDHVGGEGQPVRRGYRRSATATLLPNTSWIQRSRGRLRRDLELGGEHAQIMPVAGTQHDAVLAERDGTRIAIFGLVMIPEQRYRDYFVIPDSLIYELAAQFQIAMPQNRQ